MDIVVDLRTCEIFVQRRLHGPEHIGIAHSAPIGHVGPGKEFRLQDTRPAIKFTVFQLHTHTHVQDKYRGKWLQRIMLYFCPT